MKSDKPDKKEIANKFASMFNIDLNDQEHIKENVINGIIGKMSPDIMKQNNEFLSFSSQEMNKILNGIEVYSKIDEKNKSKKDLEDKEYTSLTFTETRRNLFESVEGSLSQDTQNNKRCSQ